MKRLFNVFLFLLLLLNACSSSYWIYRETDTDCDAYNSAMLSHPPSEPFKGIEFQLLQGEFGLLGYLNVFCGIIPSIPGNDHAANVLVTIDGQGTLFQAVRLKGGQRLLLPEEATQLIINSLMNCKKVDVMINDYHSKISPEGFQTYYFQMLN